MSNNKYIFLYPKQWNQLVKSGEIQSSFLIMEELLREEKKESKNYEKLNSLSKEDLIFHIEEIIDEVKRTLCLVEEIIDVRVFHGEQFTIDRIEDALENLNNKILT